MRIKNRSRSHLPDERDAWRAQLERLPANDPRRAEVEAELKKLERRASHSRGGVGRQGSEQVTGRLPTDRQDRIRSQHDRLIVEDLNQNATRGWKLEPGNAIVIHRGPRDLWAYVERAGKISFDKLPLRQRQALGLSCFGEWLEFAYICWEEATVESLQAMHQIVVQQALEGLLLSKKVAILMPWTRTGRPVNHKNAQEYVREALNRLGLERGELLMLLGRGILDRMQWTARGRWAQKRITAAQRVE